MTFSMMESAWHLCLSAGRDTRSAPACCTKQNRKPIQTHIDNQRFNRYSSLLNRGKYTEEFVECKDMWQKEKRHPALHWSFFSFYLPSARFSHLSICSTKYCRLADTPCRYFYLQGRIKTGGGNCHRIGSFPQI